MNFWGRVLKAFSWKVEITVTKRDKCVICVAPHTSNWDFIIGLAAYRSLGRKANFLMKDFWFFFPLKYILQALGGIPVHRVAGGSNLTRQIIERFNECSYMNLAVTPEGTRSATSRWKTGFLYMAYGAKVPIQLGIIDYNGKRVIIRDEYFPTGNVETDLEAVKRYYSDWTVAARYPEKFKA